MKMSKTAFHNSGSELKVENSNIKTIYSWKSARILNKNNELMFLPGAVFILLSSCLVWRWGV